MRRLQNLSRALDEVPNDLISYVCARYGLGAMDFFKKATANRIAELYRT